MIIPKYYDLTEKAFKEGKIRDLLLGIGPWKLPTDRYFPGNIPTNWEPLITYGVIPYLENDTSITQKKNFEDSFVSLLTDNPTEIWSAYNIYSCFCYASTSQVREKYFTLNLTSALAICIKENSDALKKCKAYDGYRYEDGLWADIMSADAMLQKRFGAGIL